MQNFNMKKILVWGGVILVFCILFYGYNSNNKLTLSKDTNTSDYSEQTNNLYKNTKYNFSVTFPDNWKRDNGETVNTVQRAISGSSTINIMVQQLNLSKPEQILSIKDLISPEEFFNSPLVEGIKKQVSDIKNIKYGELKINDEPAYWVEYYFDSQLLDYKMTQMMYFFLKGNNLYTIGLDTATSEYETIKPLFNQVVNTFVFKK